MKEYKNYVIWLDYFNSELKRREGRRVALSMATRSPGIAELTEACRRLNLQASPQVAKYPGSPVKESGYVSVTKSGAKHSLFMQIAKELAVVRGIGQKKAAASQSGRKKPNTSAKV